MQIKSLVFIIQCQIHILINRNSIVSYISCIMHAISSIMFMITCIQQYLFGRNSSKIKLLDILYPGINIEILLYDINHYHHHSGAIWMITFLSIEYDEQSSLYWLEMKITSIFTWNIVEIHTCNLIENICSIEIQCGFVKSRFAS